MSGPIEQQLHDYFADLDASQRHVDVAAIAADHGDAVDTIVAPIDLAPSRHRRRSRAFVLVAAAAVVAVLVGLLTNVNGESRSVEIVPADPGPDASIPNVLRMSCPEIRPGDRNEGGRPTLESDRVALQADGLHVEVAPHREDGRGPFQIRVATNDYIEDPMASTKPDAVSRFVVGPSHLTDLPPSAIKLSIFCVLPDAAGDFALSSWAPVEVEDPANVWVSRTGGCRGNAAITDTVKVENWKDLLDGSPRFSRWLREVTPGLRASDSIESGDYWSVVRDGETVARWYSSYPQVVVLVACPGSGIGTPTES